MADLELRTATELDGTAGNELAADNIIPITRAAAGSGLFRTKLSTLKAWLLGNGTLGQVFTQTAGGPAWADPTGGGGGGGGLIDAPSDGSTYGRRNGAWSAVTGGGGGGGSAPWYFDPPLVADFPVNNGAVAITTADDPDVGMTIEADGPFAYCRAIGQALTATGDFQVTMRSEFVLLNDHYANFGIALWNASSPKVILFGFDGRNASASGHMFRLNAAAFDGYEDFINTSGTTPKWVRVRYNATTGVLQGYMSADGKLWVATLSHNMLTDFGAPTFCGIGIAADTYSHHLGLSVQYFKVE